MARDDLANIGKFLDELANGIGDTRHITEVAIGVLHSSDFSDELADLIRVNGPSVNQTVDDLIKKICDVHRGNPDLIRFVNSSSLFADALKHRARTSRFTTEFHTLLADASRSEPIDVQALIAKHGVDEHNGAVELAMNMAENRARRAAGAAAPVQQADAAVQPQAVAGVPNFRPTRREILAEKKYILEELGNPEGLDEQVLRFSERWLGGESQRVKQKLDLEAAGRLVDEPTHDQITELDRYIRSQLGWPQGIDEPIWLFAENLLRDLMRSPSPNTVPVSSVPAPGLTQAYQPAAVRGTTQTAQPTTATTAATTRQAVPATDDVAPVLDDAAAATDDAAPVADDVAAATDDVAPATDDIAAATDDVAPAVDDLDAAARGVRAAQNANPYQGRNRFVRLLLNARDGIVGALATWKPATRLDPTGLRKQGNALRYGAENFKYQQRTNLGRVAHAARRIADTFAPKAVRRMAGGASANALNNMLDKIAKRSDAYEKLLARQGERYAELAETITNGTDAQRVAALEELDTLATKLSSADVALRAEMRGLADATEGIQKAANDYRAALAEAETLKLSPQMKKKLKVLLEQQENQLELIREARRTSRGFEGLLKEISGNSESANKRVRLLYSTNEINNPLLDITDDIAQGNIDDALNNTQVMIRDILGKDTIKQGLGDELADMEKNLDALEEALSGKAKSLHETSNWNTQIAEAVSETNASLSFLKQYAETAGNSAAVTTLTSKLDEINSLARSGNYEEALNVIKQLQTDTGVQTVLTNISQTVASNQAKIDRAIAEFAAKKGKEPGLLRQSERQKAIIKALGETGAAQHMRLTDTLGQTPDSVQGVLTHLADKLEISARGLNTNWDAQILQAQRALDNQTTLLRQEALRASNDSGLPLQMTSVVRMMKNGQTEEAAALLRTMSGEAAEQARRVGEELPAQMGALQESLLKAVKAFDEVDESIMSGQVHGLSSYPRYWWSGYINPRSSILRGGHATNFDEASRFRDVFGDKVFSELHVRMRFFETAENMLRRKKLTNPDFVFRPEDLAKDRAAKIREMTDLIKANYSGAEQAEKLALLEDFVMERIRFTTMQYDVTRSGGLSQQFPNAIEALGDRITPSMREKLIEAYKFQEKTANVERLGGSMVNLFYPRHAGDRVSDFLNELELPWLGNRIRALPGYLLGRTYNMEEIAKSKESFGSLGPTLYRTHFNKTKWLGNEGFITLSKNPVRLFFIGDRTARVIFRPLWDTMRAPFRLARQYPIVGYPLLLAGGSYLAYKGYNYASNMTDEWGNEQKANLSMSKLWLEEQKYVLEQELIGATPEEAQVIMVQLQILDNIIAHSGELEQALADAEADVTSKKETLDAAQAAFDAESAKPQSSVDAEHLEELETALNTARTEHATATTARNALQTDINRYTDTIGQLREKWEAAAEAEAEISKLTDEMNDPLTTSARVTEIGEELETLKETAESNRTAQAELMIALNQHVQQQQQHLTPQQLQQLTPQQQQQLQQLLLLQQQQQPLTPQQLAQLQQLQQQQPLAPEPPSGDDPGGDSDRDNGEGGIMDALGNWGSAYADMTRVDANDRISTGFNQFGRGLMNGAKGVASWAGDTFNAMARPGNKEGQAWLGLGGGLLGGIFGGMLVNKLLWDKIGIGKIPVIGSVVKIVTFVAIFMAARKGVHGFMQSRNGEHLDRLRVNGGAGARDGEDTDGEGEGEGEAGDVGGGKTVLNKVVIRMQSHGGNLPEMITMTDPDDPNNPDDDQAFFDHIEFVETAAGEYAVQIHADNGTTFAPELIGQGRAGNIAHMPAELIEKLRANPPTFEAVDHFAADGTPGQDGKMDSFKLTVDGQDIFHAAIPQGSTFEDLGRD